MSGRFPVVDRDCGFTVADGKLLELGCSAFTHCTLGGTGAEATGAFGAVFQFPGARGQSSGLFAVLVVGLNALFAAPEEEVIVSADGVGCVML